MKLKSAILIGALITLIGMPSCKKESEEKVVPVTSIDTLNDFHIMSRNVLFREDFNTVGNWKFFADRFARFNRAMANYYCNL